jgi:hypothetical protein
MHVRADEEMVIDGGSGSDGGRDVDDEQQQSSNLMLWFLWWCCWLAPGGSERQRGRRTDAARLDDACGGQRCSLAYWSSGRRRLGPGWRTAVLELRAYWKRRNHACMRER